MKNFWEKTSIFSALLMIFGSFIYQVFALNFLGLFISLILVISVYIILQKSSNIKPKQENQKKILPKFSQEKSFYFLIFLNLLFFLLLILLLLKNSSYEALISPWQVIPKSFWGLYFSYTIILIISLKKINHRAITIFLTSFYYFLNFGLALFVYKVYYGFDPFVHEATLNLIKQDGYVLPKTFYYLGFYTLIIFFNKIFFIPIFLLNKFIVPFLAALFLPYYLQKLTDKYFENKENNRFLPILFLSLPFSFFIISTPQNLAYLFLLLTVIQGLLVSRPKDFLYVFIFALASLSIHPIAGLPAVLYGLFVSAFYFNYSYKKVIIFFIYIISILALPLAFGLYQALNFNFNFSSLLSSPPIRWPSKENFILNFSYLYYFNLDLIIILLTFFGVIIAKKTKQAKKFFINLLFFSALFISYLLVKQINFDYLINYEQDNYGQRILLISLFFLFPFILLSLNRLSNQARKQNRGVFIPLFVFFLLLLSLSLYNSYPRLDNYYNSRGYSTSKQDIEIIKKIHTLAEGEKYLVLANQQVSAAALREFGFNYYLKDDIYFYPIPTSGELYQFYLKMVYEYPKKETMQKAMELGNVKKSYLIINDYWWAFDKIKEEAKLEADNYFQSEKHIIFEFDFL